MNYILEDLLHELREARLRKGFSQRELSALAGVPQSHISKIEAGDVDLRMSSLIGLARALDLELFIAPKKALPAIQSIIRSVNNPQQANTQVPAYRLEDDDDE